MTTKARKPPREVELAHPSHQPSKAEKEAPIEFPEGTTPKDLARALMQPARVRYAAIARSRAQHDTSGRVGTGSAKIGPIPGATGHF